MGRPRKHSEAGEVMKNTDQVLSPVQEEQVGSTEGQITEPENAEAPKKTSHAPIKLETKGKFNLFQVGEAFEIKNDFGHLISKPETEEEGRALLAGMNRFNQ